MRNAMESRCNSIIGDLGMGMGMVSLQRKIGKLQELYSRTSICERLIVCLFFTQIATLYYAYNAYHRADYAQDYAYDAADKSSDAADACSSALVYLKRIEDSADEAAQYARETVSQCRAR